ncbi:MAG: mannosyltransferase [Solirubrobacteraceae bacterium]|jgi:4-amino-4-deoxy-L-arabinose transferase-like glycosyltransferase|nr:mannosyltransferase [Solirubrobacteraceae bacterium]
MSGHGGRASWVVGGLVVAGAALRLATLDAQSLWYDEAGTLSVLRPGLGATFSAVRDQEATPPLYFALLWVWSKVFGQGEVGLRSLSALAGTATIPVAYWIGRDLVSRRAGMVAAALVAFDPMLVWYSQEARAYALLVLLAALSLWFFARALREPRPRDLAAWGIASALALATHYVAGFLILPEAVWLLLRLPGARRAVALAAAPVAVTGLALAPLARDQTSGPNDPSWIGNIPLDLRLGQVVHELLTAHVGLVNVAVRVAPPRGYGVAAALLVIAGFWALAARGEPAERHGAGVALGVAGLVLAVPLAIALVRNGYFFDRDVIVAVVPFLVALAAGLGAARAGRAGLIAAGALCAIGLAVSVTVAADPALRRPPWRDVARAVGPPRPARLVLFTPPWAHRALRVYRQREGALQAPLGAGGATVDELALVAQDASAAALPAAIGPFRRTGASQHQAIAVAHYRSPRPVLLTPATLGADPIARAALAVAERPAD